MSAEILRRAADLIEIRAAAATPGPWLIEHDYAGDVPQALFVEVGDDDPDGYDGTRGVGGFDEPADNVWAGMLGPQVGELLAAWLRAEADCFVSDAAGGPLPQAVAFARALLGDQE